MQVYCEIGSMNLSCVVFVACSSHSHTDRDHATRAFPLNSGMVYVQGLVWSLQYKHSSLHKQPSCLAHPFC